MINAKCDIKIEGVDFQIIVNVGSMVDVERKTGKKFMTVVDEAEKNSILSQAALLASCLHKDGKAVGADFINDMEFDTFLEVSAPLYDTIIKSLPKKNGKKKVEVVIPAQER